MLFIYFLIVTLASAAVVKKPKHHKHIPARPGHRAHRVAVAAASASVAAPPNAAVKVVDAEITESPTAAAQANCTPSSVCFDGFTCGQRYGGCYDSNYCDGNTSPYPVPTCASTVARDLTKDNVNGAVAVELEQADTRADVVVETK